MYSGRMMNATDAELVSLALAGDTDAFGALVRRYEDAVFNLAWRMSNNWHDAADIAQDTFIRAYRKLSYYRPSHSFKTWLFSLCANLAKNRFRGIQRRRRAEERLREEMPPLSPEPEAKDVGLEEALRRIPDKLRAALVLKHMEGLSYEEVARALGIGVSAAKMRVARGRDELVRLLERRSNDESE